MNIGTRKNIMSNLKQFFPKLKKGKPIKGKPRVGAMAKDGLASIELIGRPDRTVSATVLLPMPNDAPQIRTRNLMTLLLFLKATFPEIGSPSAWITEQVNEISSHTGDWEKTVDFADRSLRVTFSPATSFLIATVAVKGF